MYTTHTNNAATRERCIFPRESENVARADGRVSEEEVWGLTVIGHTHSHSSTSETLDPGWLHVQVIPSSYRLLSLIELENLYIQMIISSKIASGVEKHISQYLTQLMSKALQIVPSNRGASNRLTESVPCAKLFFLGLTSDHCLGHSGSKGGV